MGEIVAVANQKGGVGKTTLSIHLAAYLANRGRRVIVVDSDPQANATSWAMDGQMEESGLYEVLIARQPLPRVLRPGKWGISLLPGSGETGDALNILKFTGKPFDTIARALQPLAYQADYVFIDMPPSRFVQFRQLLYAAHWLVVPTQLERLSLEGVTFMYRTVQELQEEYGNAPQLLAVVPNMTRHVTREHQEQMETLVKTFGPVVWPPIPQSVRVAEACAFGVTLFEHAPKEKVTEAMRRVGQRFWETLEGEV